MADYDPGCWACGSRGVEHFRCCELLTEKDKTEIAHREEVQMKLIALLDDYGLTLDEFKEVLRSPDKYK